MYWHKHQNLQKFKAIIWIDMAKSLENHYNLVVAGMLAGRQPKVASVYQSYCGLSVTQCLITLQRGIIRSLSSLQLGSISLLSMIHKTINIFEEVDIIWVQCNYIKCIFCTHVFTNVTKQLRSLISLFFLRGWTSQYMTADMFVITQKDF